MRKTIMVIGMTMCMVVGAFAAKEYSKYVGKVNSVSPKCLQINWMDDGTVKASWYCTLKGVDGNILSEREPAPVVIMTLTNDFKYADFMDFMK